MPTDPSDPSSPKPSTRLSQPTSDTPAGGGGGIFFVILLVLLLGGGAAYYFLVYKPAAAAGATIVAPPTVAAGTPKPAVTPKVDPSGNATYSNAQRTQYIKQADDSFIALRDAKTVPFTAAFNTLLTAGGFSAAGLATKESIAARRDLVAKCQTANDDYEAFTKTQDATFKAELQKTPLIPNDVDYVLSDFSYKAQTDKNMQLRGLQRDSLKSGDEILAYLDKSFGNWSVNAAQHLVFKKPADSAAFASLQKTYSEQVTAMNKLQGDIKATADPSSVATTTPSASPATASPTVSPTAAPSASPAASATP